MSTHIEPPLNIKYSWITEYIAIGELNAPYHNFDIIVNLAYINPHYNKGLEHDKMEIMNTYGSKNTKRVYRIGVYDSDSDKDIFSKFMIIVVSDLLKYKSKSKDNKILFHCQAGKSRSVCMCLAYLCKSEAMSYEDALQLIQQKRPIINPREEFLDTVKTFVSYREVR
jgi:protein-tyrosine phosphatase